jgi:hypothetical protein
MVSNRHGGETPSWWGATTPATSVANSAQLYVGNFVKFTVPGRVFGIRWYYASGITPSKWGILVDRDSVILLSVRHFKPASLTAGTWQNTWIHPTIRIDTSHTYAVAALFLGTPYTRTNNLLTSPVTHNNIQFLHGFQTTNGELTNVIATETNHANGVDVLFSPD